MMVTELGLRLEPPHVGKYAIWISDPPHLILHVGSFWTTLFSSLDRVWKSDGY